MSDKKDILSIKSSELQTYLEDLLQNDKKKELNSNQQGTADQDNNDENNSDNKYIVKKVDSSLLQLKVISMEGILYRYVFGKKTLTTVSSFSELTYTDNTVLLTEERFPGDSNVHYTRNEITVDKSTDNDDISSDFSFTEIGNYSMQGYMFDYQVIPTLDQGPKVVKTFVSPTHLFTIKGYLSDDLIKPDSAQNIALYEKSGSGAGGGTFGSEPLKNTLLPQAAHLQATIGTQLEKTITL